MFFLVDNNNKIIFGWSPKSGCSHVKNIFWFLQTGLLKNKIHTKKDSSPLPKDIENYTTLIFCRHPYDRLLSGFLDKYRLGGIYRYFWNKPILTFSKFVDELTINNWNLIEKTHLEPQLSAKFNNKILLSKIIKFYDIANIDYHYIEKLYNKKIPDAVINKKMGHERSNRMNKEWGKKVYDLNIDIYNNYNINNKYFFNEKIIEKVFNFFIEDFNFFNKYGLDYKKYPF